MMRIGLVAGTIALALGLIVAGAAGPLSGEWWSATRVGFVGGLTIDWAYSVLDVDYAVGPLVFGSLALVGLDGPRDLCFDAYGKLGPFAVASFLDFDPILASFELFTLAAWVDLAGVEAYALFLLDGGRWWNGDVKGSGLNLGVLGSVGDAVLGVELAWNTPYPFLVVDAGGYHYYEYLRQLLLIEEGLAGYDYEPGSEFSWWRVNCDGTLEPGILWAVEKDGCDLCFSGAYVSALCPFSCFDLRAYLRFSSAGGFDLAYLDLLNVDLGIPWLRLDAVGIDLATSSQSIGLFDLDLVVLDACFEPFFSLGAGDCTLSDVCLQGLTFEWAWSGVTVKGGTIFDDTMAWFDQDGNRAPHLDPEIEDALPDFCYMPFYDEYLAILVGGESCCGGKQAFSLFVWFDIDDDQGDPAGLFGWQETVVQAGLDVAPGVTLSAGLSVLVQNLNWLELRVDVVW
jgi:hypothetical protein